MRKERKTGRERERQGKIGGGGRRGTLEEERRDEGEKEVVEERDRKTERQRERKYKIDPNHGVNRVKTARQKVCK